MTKGWNLKGSVKSAQPTPSEEGGGWPDSHLYKYHYFYIWESGHPPPSAEGVGWPDWTLPFKFPPSVILLNPNSSHHSPIILINVSVKSGHPPPSAAGGGWPDFR